MKLSQVNISIDDISPHPRSSVKVLDRCFDLIGVFPSIKFTLFVPMSYQRLGEANYAVSDYPEFCETLRALSKDNFELAWHGYNHCIDGISNNDEFRDLNFAEACEVLHKMFTEAQRAKIDDLLSPIFRPSAFRMSPASFDACRGKGIKVLALSCDPALNVAYKGKDKEVDDVVYYNVNPPFSPLKLFSKTEVVYHACEWDKNYLDETKSLKLKDFLNQHIYDIEFVFMEKMI